MTAAAANINIEFQGEGVNEVGIDISSGKTIVKVNPRYYRPAEVDLLIGDPQKAADKLKWKPKMKLEELCSIMFDADISRNERGFSF